MEVAEYVAGGLERLMKEHFRKKFGDQYTQKNILENFNSRNINISQSVLSKLMNWTYLITSSENKVFRSVAVFLGEDPENLWSELIAGFENRVGSTSRLSIGIPSTATFTAPLLNAIDKDFPDWLDLAHVHEKGMMQNPIFVNKDNYETELFEHEINKDPVDGFSDCYLSGDLPQLLYHEDKSLNDKRKFDAILCPDELIRRQSTSAGSYTILSDDKKNPILKVATITNGFSGLACLFEKRQRSAGETLDEDLEEKNYNIRYVPKEFDTNELNDDDPAAVEKNKQKHFEEFLDVLKQVDTDAPFCVYGFGTSVAFKVFTDFLEENFEKKTDDPERDRLIQKLYSRRPETIDFNKDDTAKYIKIARAVEAGERLLLIGYSPYMHNTWQLVSRYIQLDKEKEYVNLTRFNFSQWLGKNSFSLYLAKSSCNLDNVKKLHELLSLISRKWEGIEKNRTLDSFFFYTKDGTNFREPKLLYNRACREMGFTEGSPNYLVNYTKEFMNYLMDSVLR